ncbi:MAG TPA: prepilin peptidase [Pseudonocardiaceae bacterium]|nr:prepilin peptidase [Pseudonocardiaceae bacterium]
MAGVATRLVGAAIRLTGGAARPAGAATRAAGAAIRSASAAIGSASGASRRWSSTGWRRAAFVPAIVALVGFAVVMPAPALVLGFALVGAAMGGAGRVWLGRLREPVVCRAPWCEIAGAALSGTVGWLGATGLLVWWWLPVPLVLGWFAVPLAAADVLRGRLPNALTLAALPALVLVTVPYEPAPLAGAAVFGAAHAAVRLLAPRSLGGGDVKLAAALGVVLGVLGWADLVLAAFLASLITLSIAIVTRRRTAPHGPGLLAATWLLAALTPLAGLPYRG